MGLFSRFSKAKADPVAETRVPDGMLVYAIGDIHGRDDLFAELLGQIDADRASRPHRECALVLLGDLVDRGPDSAAVVERAMTLPARFDHFHWLIGNHEECFLAALTGDERRVRYFARIGGDATMRSYWGDDADYESATFEVIADELPRRVPRAHVEFLGRGEDWVLYGDYAFVHAGIRPGIAIDRQATSDLRWIREEFLDSRADHGLVVVHGHSITDAPETRANRIGIDTGAYQSGVLTALGLMGADRWFLATSA